MPAAVNQFIQDQNYDAAQRQQTIILTTYRDAFGKYAKLSDHKYLQKVFEQTPAFVGQQLQYSKMDPDSRSRDLKRAIRDLAHAGVLQTIYATTASDLPLNALINEKKIKLLFLDVGLVNKTIRITMNDLLKEDITLINKGALAEQWAGQELLAYMNPHEAPQLHFWVRDKSGSNAEVDYVLAVDSTIIPIEIKAGKTGRLKFLHLFMQEKQSPIGVHISQATLAKKDNILSVPFYLISELPRLIGEFI